MPLTPGQRRLRASIGANEMHAQGKTNTRPARAAYLRKFETLVDPDGTLEPDERARRAAHALSAHMSRLALKRHRQTITG